MSLRASHHPKPAPELIRQRWGRVLRPSWVKDNSSLTLQLKPSGSVCARLGSFPTLNAAALDVLSLAV